MNMSNVVVVTSTAALSRRTISMIEHMDYNTTLIIKPMTRTIVGQKIEYTIIDEWSTYRIK